MWGGGDIIPVVYRLGKVVPGDNSSAISPMFTNKFWEKWASPAVGPDKAGLIIQIILPKQPDIVHLQQMFGSEQLVRYRIQCCGSESIVFVRNILLNRIWIREQKVLYTRVQ